MAQWNKIYRALDKHVNTLNINFYSSAHLIKYFSVSTNATVIFILL